jgi:hypothetical protein
MKLLVKAKEFILAPVFWIVIIMIETNKKKCLVNSEMTNLFIKPN